MPELLELDGRVEPLPAAMVMCRCDASVFMHRLTPEMLEQRGVSLQQALATLRQCLPTDAVLVGQGIGQDVQWLQLHEGRDFQVVGVLPSSCLLLTVG
jgi:hypothetical protein